jgi:ABC-type antimicrobial peptide transport system permease subunit
MSFLRHYLLTAYRNLVRYKAFSIINVTGLALGLTCCLLIYVWVQDERRVDNFHANSPSLYSLYYTLTANGEKSGDYDIPYEFSVTDFKTGEDLADGLKESFPEILYALPYATTYELPWGHAMTFQVGERLHKLEGATTGSDFFKMFSYPLIAGDANHALKDISSIAISRKMAEMFFDNPQNAIGKSIRYENVIDFTVAAVFENVPEASSLKFDYLINWEKTRTSGQIERSDNRWPTYIQLRPDADVAQVSAKIRNYLQDRRKPEATYDVALGLKPFKDQYLESRFVNGEPQGGRIEYVRIFTGVAIFILIIACINFMNLATARALKRAKEVGVRKVIGSSRLHLVGQFFGESILLALLAAMLAVTVMQLTLPAFNMFTGKNISSPVYSTSFWFFMSGLILFTGMLAGSYPALFLSSLKPVKVLKGVLRFTTSSIWLRKGLTVFQFSLSIVLLIATIVISRQTSYVQHTHLGYDRENLIYMRMEGELGKKNKYLAFKQQASAMPGIAMVDRSSEAPHAMGFVIADAINWEGKEEGTSVGFKPTSVGFDFLKLMNLKLAEGRDFSRANTLDTTAFMVNEEAVKQMGMKDPIGKWVSAWAKKGPIIAVLKDYHTHSLHEPIKPLILDVKEYEYFGVVIIRIEPGKTKEALASLEKVYKDINPNYPFAYQFLDQEYEKLYRNEQVVSGLSNAFAVLAGAISCLGLLGLVMFSAEQRIKEIGIRKVLGATVASILTLLSRDFLVLVCLAFLIAAPGAGYFMNRWLESFAFKVPLSWWIFALAGGASVLVALLTILVQGLQSARANPVKALRSE